MALVEIDGLTIAFDGHSAVRNLSLSIEKGDRLGIIGESGSGKSMTALAIAGLLPATASVTGADPRDLVLITGNCARRGRTPRGRPETLGS